MNTKTENAREREIGMSSNEAIADEGAPAGAKETEKPEQTAPTVSVFGKFQTGGELLKAYNSLESEFTKRSQKLKELECEKEKLVLSLQAKETEVKKCLDDETYIEENIVKNSKVSQKIIESYLKEILSSLPPAPLSSKVGRSALTPVNKPKDLKEAKQLADILLRS